LINYVGRKENIVYVKDLLSFQLSKFVQFYKWFLH